VSGHVGDEDRVSGGLGELLDAGRDIDGVANQGELEFAYAADEANSIAPGTDAGTAPVLICATHGHNPLGVDRTVTPRHACRIGTGTMSSHG
jgi:hypothetical protein